jgi:hypothetical protein
MPHKNPTLSAETQVLDPAHPSSRVGSGNPPDQNPEDTSQFSAIFSQAERLQLSEAIDLNLKDEIKMMKKGIREFAKASEGVKNGEPYNEELGKVLNDLGLSCGRLANLMRVQLLLQGPQSKGMLEDLMNAMSDFVEKMTAEEEEQND